MKKFLMLCCIFLLSACFNESYDFKGESFDEPVEAILIETDRIYFIGSTISAVFDSTLVDNTKASDVIKNLQQLLQNPYAKKIDEHLIQLSIYDNKIRIAYTPKIRVKNLTENDISALQNLGFRFNHSGEYLYKSYAHLGGRITQFNNRAEVLAKYKLKQPIIAKAKSYQKKTEFSFDDTVAVIAAPITIPMAVILLPFFNDAPN